MKILDEIHVMGRSSLNGSVSIQGSKNAALPMMACARYSAVWETLHRLPGAECSAGMSADFGCILHGRDPERSGSCYLVGGT